MDNFLSELLAQQFFGNTLPQYLLFAVVAGIFMVLGKVLSYLSKAVGRKITKKTKNRFDDLLLDLVEEPIVFAFIIVGLSAGFQFLSFPSETAGIFYRILEILAILFAAWIGVKFVDAVIKVYLKPLAEKTDSKLDDQLLPIISKFIKGTILVLAFIIILSSFGYDVTALVAGLGIGGLAFAFAAQATIADAFGGISIFTSKAFVVGDIIKVGGVLGTVEEVGLRFTRIRTFDKRLLTMPNSKIATDIIENISSEPARRIVQNIGITYETPPKKIRKAMELISKIINTHKGCEKGTERIFFSEYKDYSLNIMVIYFIKDKDNWQIISGEINQAIKEEFDKAKIDFAYPTQNIYLKKQ